MIKKPIYIIISIIVLITFAMFILIRTNSDSSDLEVQDIPSSNQAKKPLTVTNYSNFRNTINESDLSKFIESVEVYVNKDNLTKSYTAIIREGSVVSTEANEISNTTFIIDIPEIKRSYKADIGKDVSTGQNTLYTLCINESERIYPKFDCKDDLNV